MWMSQTCNQDKIFNLVQFSYFFKSVSMEFKYILSENGKRLVVNVDKFCQARKLSDSPGDSRIRWSAARNPQPKSLKPKPLVHRALSCQAQITFIF